MANKEGESTIGVVIKATNFAAIKHSNQRRKDEAKSPYINHPIGVAFILIEEGKITDPAVIQVRKLINKSICLNQVYTEPLSMYGIMAY